MSFAQKLLDGKVFGRALHGGQRVTRKTLNSLVGKEKVQNYKNNLQKCPFWVAVKGLSSLKGAKRSFSSNKLESGSK